MRARNDQPGTIRPDGTETAGIAPAMADLAARLAAAWNARNPRATPRTPADYLPR